MIVATMIFFFLAIKKLVDRRAKHMKELVLRLIFRQKKQRVEAMIFRLENQWVESTPKYLQNLFSFVGQNLQSQKRLT